jgi:hypothetical protein
MEAGAFRASAEELVAALEAYLSSIPQLRAIARDTAARYGQEIEGVADLDEVEAEWRALREAAGRVLAQAGVPRAAVDPRRLQEALAAAEQGNHEKIEDVIARLGAGGEL